MSVEKDDDARARDEQRSVDSGVFIANERYKAVSSMLFNLGAGLLATAVVKLYVDRVVGIEPLGWFFTSLVIIWIAWKILYLLESEK